MRAYGWAGLGVVLGAEAPLFSGNRLVAEWFTPIVWTGYVVFIDAVVARVPFVPHDVATILPRCSSPPEIAAPRWMADADGDVGPTLI